MSNILSKKDFANQCNITLEELEKAILSEVVNIENNKIDFNDIDNFSFYCDCKENKNSTNVDIYKELQKDEEVQKKVEKLRSSNLDSLDLKDIDLKGIHDPLIVDLYLKLVRAELTKKQAKIAELKESKAKGSMLPKDLFIEMISLHFNNYRNQTYQSVKTLINDIFEEFQLGREAKSRYVSIVEQRLNKANEKASKDFLKSSEILVENYSQSNKF
ncbi:hypothetical protein [Flammeovirga pacifica]|uniref:Uncharacterized protein n=1 Tax=Flammeovirga pacifica TaxID=915059 RepID=A0A1S1Z0E1_FLAPC|nr:hypothetical protein [Flammeovirga pacifica]OHX66730.1 hypothetical protein NH26_10355 [Flammeovirga pacifica]